MGVKVKDILKQTVVYVNEYSADMEEPDVYGTEAQSDLLAHIDAAARMVAQVAPANMQVAQTEPQYELTLQERPDGRLHGVAALPSDYMRLVYLMSAALYRPITVLLPATHPTYAMQFCPVAGLGAGEYAPIGYQVDGTVDVHSFNGNVNVNDNGNVNGNDGADGDQTAGAAGGEEQGAGAADETGTTVGVTLCYLKLPKVTGEGEAAEYSTLKEELRDVIAMQAAALYLGMNEADKANQAQQMASAMLKGIASEE